MTASRLVPKSCLGRVFNFKLGCFAIREANVQQQNTTPFRVENSAQELNHFINLPCWCYIILSACHFNAMCNVQFRYYIILPTFHFSAASFCLLAILMLCHFINYPFWTCIILSTCRFDRMSIHQLAILMPCHFINLPF